MKFLKTYCLGCEVCFYFPILCPIVNQSGILQRNYLKFIIFKTPFLKLIANRIIKKFSSSLIEILFS